MALTVIVEFVVTHCGAWWRIGRVDVFRPVGRGFESRSSRHLRDLHLQLPVARACKLRYSVNNCCDRERFLKAHAVSNAIEMDKYNTIQNCREIATTIEHPCHLLSP